MSNILKWSLKKSIIAFGAVFSLFVAVGAFLAPVFAGLKLFPISEFLYNFLHKLCCTYETNSFFIMGNPVGMCARCAGAYITAAVTLYIYLNKYKINKIAYIILGLLCLVEISLEMCHYIHANDFIKLLSGLCLGVFIATTLIKLLDWLEGKKNW